MSSVAIHTGPTVQPMLQPRPRSMSRSRPAAMPQWNAHHATSSSSAGMLSQFGIPPNVTIATFTHQKAPVKKTIPPSIPAPKARQGDSRRMARSIGTRQMKASGSRIPEVNSSRRGPTGKAMGKAAAPSRPVRTRAPSLQGTRTRSRRPGMAVRAGEAPGEGGKATADIGRGAPTRTRGRARVVPAPDRPQGLPGTIPGRPRSRASTAAIRSASGRRWWSCPRRWSSPCAR